jgi:hypothetical protein
VVPPLRLRPGYSLPREARGSNLWPKAGLKVPHAFLGEQAKHQCTKYLSETYLYIQKSNFNTLVNNLGK